MRRGLWSLVFLGVLSGCGGGSLNGGARSPRGTGPTAAVSDDAFPGALRDLLLSEPGSKEERARLKGVEERQMLRAAVAFKKHQTERGLGSVRGGLYLARVGESDDLLNASARDALHASVRELSQRGDEGGATALFNLWRPIATPAEKKEIDQHLEALRAWSKGTAVGLSATERAGALENVAVARAVLEPSEDARIEADKRIKEWVEAAVKYAETASSRRDPRQQMGPDEERYEAARAFQTSASILAALRLREGDVPGALGVLEDAESRQFPLDHRLMTALKEVDESAEPKHWVDLLQALRPRSGREQREDDTLSQIDSPELLRAAAFGVAREAYRNDPSTPAAAAALAIALQNYGMADASPAVLVDAAKAHVDVQMVSEALALSMHAIATEVEANDTDGARRAFRAAAPIIAIADSKELAGKVQPSSARMRAMMGEVELHDGRLQAAKQLFETAAKQEKLGGVLAALARIERASGNNQAAMARLNEALSAPDVAKDAALRGEILLAESDIAREAGDTTNAREPLITALKGLAQARTQGEPEARARVERTLARVLDRLGATKQAHQALDRALDATPRDKDEVAATLGIASAQALVRNDLTSAQDALRHALASDLTDDDLVYMALWTRAIEKQMKVPTDGDADKVFASIADDGLWTGKLAAFGAGKIKAADLIAAAKTPAQKTEAFFYAALDRRSVGDSVGAQSLLKQALGAGGIDLVEISLARDLLDGPKAQLAGTVPDVGLP